MHIISSPVPNIKSLHPLVSHNHVLQGIIPCLSNMNLSRRVWRSLQKVKLLLSLFFLFCLLVNLIFLPKTQDFFLNPFKLYHLNISPQLFLYFAWRIIQLSYLEYYLRLQLPPSASPISPRLSTICVCIFLITSACNSSFKIPWHLSRFFSG